ncbi:type I restriction endonuclease subunit R [Streptomyces tibetensis]|uniref:type I restriction endonuclease subunit R n=1 Tax=Streptomyces tibetensis TaxID=2382123 RepID=UPI0033D76A1B
MDEKGKALIQNLHLEFRFQDEIASYLHSKGWKWSRNDEGYDAERALFPEDVIGWLQDTQPEALAKVIRTDGDPDKQTENLLNRLVKVLAAPTSSGGGTLNVLRNGFKMIPAGTLRMSQEQPETTHNPTTVRDYSEVRLRVMEEVRYSTVNGNRIDLVFFVNGIPVATAELKTDMTQSVEEAKRQYRTTRLPKDPKTKHSEPLLTPGRGALVHFAVSNDEVWMTTALAGGKTRFLPFNRGYDGGIGNPPSETGSRTDYLWRRVLQKDAWLGILHRFVYLKDGTVRFPRFHQWEAVTQLTDAVKFEGVGHRYLVQHSAGSGKTDSIAWLTHRLARLQADDTKVFDSVIVVTDRTVLDDQLQEAIRQLDGGVQGVVTTIDRKSASAAGKAKSGLLAQSLSNGKLIVVVTLQTFPFAMKEIRQSKGLAGKKFAVIADEAHSSQSGQVAAKMKAVLTSQEVADLEDGGEIDVESVLLAEAAERASSKNISFFAFTATPKDKTLEMFGRPPAGDSDGEPVPFHEYTMKQAIGEGFILDVLDGYHSYKIAFRVAQEAEAANTQVDAAQARKEVMTWVKLNPQTIAQKAAIIVEHFRDNVSHLLDGKAKAMVVADSRRGAVRYKHEIDAYIQRKGYGYSTLIAFSGTVKDDHYGADGQEFSEANMNPGVYDLRTEFATDDYQVMIVANKFQTGFDQPLLCAMYVDKKLPGVTAVQTLSRLNRTHVTAKGTVKSSAMTQVVDFVNTPEEIRVAFEPFYKGVRLETRMDPNLIYDIETKLDQAGIYTTAEIDAVAEAHVKGLGHEALAHRIDPGKRRFKERYEAAVLAGPDGQAERDLLDLFRKDVGSFVRLYDFMSQIVNYADPDLAKKHIYLSLLARVIRPDNLTAEIDTSSLHLDHIEQKDQGVTSIKLDGDVNLRGITGAGTGLRKKDEKVAFSAVIDLLNQRYGDTISAGKKTAYVEAVLHSLLEDETLVRQVLANTEAQFDESPDFYFALVSALSDNDTAFEKMNEDIYGASSDTDPLVKALASLFYRTAKTQAEAKNEGTEEA